VGSFLSANEAKARFAKLLQRVRHEERIIITRYGVTVAVLAPLEPSPAQPVNEVIAAIKAFRRGRYLGIPIKELIEEGRR